jgi:hypothetical protein
MSIYIEQPPQGKPTLNLPPGYSLIAHAGRLYRKCLELFDSQDYTAAEELHERDFSIRKRITRYLWNEAIEESAVALAETYSSQMKREKLKCLKEEMWWLKYKSGRT